jgi:hypothetical protein
VKIALFLTGYMRNWEEHFPNIQTNIIERYNTDVYISSYSYSELYMGSGMVQIDTKKVIDTYKPKEYLFRDIETLPPFNFKEGGLEISGREWSYRILRQWYTNYLGLRLFNPRDYDTVIKCRGDFSIKNFRLQTDKDLVLPAWKVHPGPCSPEDSYVDYFAHGNGYWMKKYLKLYERTKEMHDNDWGDVSLGETLIKSYIDRYIGSEHITLDYNMDWKMRDEPWMSEVQKIYKKYEPTKVVTTEMDE